jgi:hypothetical protein
LVFEKIKIKERGVKRAGSQCKKKKFFWVTGVHCPHVFNNFAGAGDGSSLL